MTWSKILGKYMTLIWNFGNLKSTITNARNHKFFKIQKKLNKRNFSEQ